MITALPHLNVPKPGENCLFYFHAAEFLFPKGQAAFASADVCIGVFRQWITKCQSKTENEAANSPSLYLLPTGASLQKLSAAPSKHQRFRESSTVIVRLRVVAHGWNSK